MINNLDAWMIWQKPIRALVICNDKYFANPWNIFLNRTQRVLQFIVIKVPPLVIFFRIIKRYSRCTLLLFQPNRVTPVYPKVNQVYFKWPHCNCFISVTKVIYLNELRKLNFIFNFKAAIACWHKITREQ